MVYFSNLLPPTSFFFLPSPGLHYTAWNYIFEWFSVVNHDTDTIREAREKIKTVHYSVGRVVRVRRYSGIQYECTGYVGLFLTSRRDVGFVGKIMFSTAINDDH